MSWVPLAERFAHLPLILAGPILRRTELQSVTVWLALKEPRMVTLRIYAKDEQGELVRRFEGTRRTVRLGDHLHVVAVMARATERDEPLAWGKLCYYDVFFEHAEQAVTNDDESTTTMHLSTPGILTLDPGSADPLHRLVYEGQPLPSFVLPPEEVGQLRIVHGSCRKPHGTGRDMLSTLDTILEGVYDSANRPQQLYLTGDQVYADDVAAPLLFALMDAGNFLLAGNQEEILPIVNAMARTLPPGHRRDVVRITAALTTTTPQNHLLALSEYAAMYLFAWSDLLWPDELPTADDIWQAYPEIRPAPEDQEQVREQYAGNIERLHSFRETLPHVRRAMANIATYMICDDHEVTDDWFLDGAWCQQVLASHLGRRVLRNALLAYALFQGWGNTPAQFDHANGHALLAAVDAWRGDEADPGVEEFYEILGLPTFFEGSGELPTSERVLDWHYTYPGSRYQVIVMNTRTLRFYRSPNDFPGLLSPRAMYLQITGAVREEAEVTIIISATPVIGVDLIESIQFWSHLRVRDNYSYDREAWALEWGTFQHFLKATSVLKRVVFLAGDVHYAFGSSLQYWDHKTKQTASFVNFTSSSLCNEGAGSSMAVLAVGYPRLLHLLRKEGTPTLELFAWDITGHRQFLDYLFSIIRKRFYQFWWSLPRLIAARRSPEEVVLPAHGWFKGTFDAFPPDRSYRLSYIPNTLNRAVPMRRRSLTFSRLVLQPVRLALGIVTFLESIVGKVRGWILRDVRNIDSPPNALQQPAQAIAHQAVHGTDAIERRLEKRRNRLVAAIFKYGRWLNRWKAGELIVGYNNIGEIHFCWTPQQKEVIQRLWWWRPGGDDGEDTLQTADYYDSLELPTPEMEPPLP